MTSEEHKKELTKLIKAAIKRYRPKSSYETEILIKSIVEIYEQRALSKTNP